MAFDLKTLLPFLTAAGGAGAGYYFLGRRKEGMEPWAVAVGGALVGYIAGQFISSKLAAPASMQQQPQLPLSPEGAGEYVDFNQPVRRALPPGRPAAGRPGYMPPMKGEAESSVRAAGVSDASMMDSMGSMEGTGEDGMGSYGLDLDVDAIDVEELVRESGSVKN